MRLKNKIEPVEQDSFNKCKLNRKPYALALTKIVEQFQDGFVLALDAEWGTGKTTTRGTTISIVW